MHNNVVSNRFFSRKRIREKKGPEHIVPETVLLISESNCQRSYDARKILAFSEVFYQRQ